MSGSSVREPGRESLGDDSTRVGVALNAPAPPPPPLMVKRRSSRLAEGRAAVAPYPPGRRRASTEAAGSSGSSGLTPSVGGCSLSGSAFDAPSSSTDSDGDALVSMVLGDMESVRQNVMRRASTMGQLEMVVEGEQMET